MSEGHTLVPEAVKAMCADSFVVETNIHYPADSSLIVDGIRKIIELSEPLASSRGLSGWRQHAQLLKTVMSVARQIALIAAKKGPNYAERLKSEYVKLLKKSGRVLGRAQEFLAALKSGTPTRSADQVVGENVGGENISNELLELTTLETFITRTQQVREVARRRVIHGEKVPSDEKLFSLFEPHTQLYKRGKAGESVQFGRLVLVFEDGAGFLTQHRLLSRTESDRAVAIPETRRLQKHFHDQFEELSFDRGFHSPENQVELAKLVKSPCLPKLGVKQAAAQLATQSAAANVIFRAAKQRLPGMSPPSAASNPATAQNAAATEVNWAWNATWPWAFWVATCTPLTAC